MNWIAVNTMKTLKVKTLMIIALALLLVVSLCSFVGIKFAHAERYVSVHGSNVFYVGGDAAVWAHRIAEPVAGEEEPKETYYTMFTFASDSDSVNLRKNLAYNWFYNSTPSTEGDGETEGENKIPTGEEGFFSMTIGFEELNFERFVITFESQQYSLTKSEKTINYIVFVPVEGGSDAVNVLITDDAEAEVPGGAQSLASDNITIAFTGYDKGVYSVQVGNDGEAAVTGEFANIGGTYARYVSSSTKPVTPLSFKAVFGEEPAGRVRMPLYELNGQSFRVYDRSARPINEVLDEDGNVDHYTGGQVNDETPPVLCLGKSVDYIKDGEEISFDYTVIDVLAASPSKEVSYFMLTKEQASDNSFAPGEYWTDGLYAKVEDSNDQYMVPHANHYMPQPADCGAAFEDENFEASAAVKVMVKLTDSTTNSSDGQKGQSTYVMLDWYADADKLITVNGNNYIAVAEDTRGASFRYGAEWENIQASYQALVDEAAADLRAGSKNYFYLPDVSSLFEENVSAYEDMTYSIYYYSNTTNNNSGRSYNNLSITITRSGTYAFTVYATDAAGNKMYYLDKDADDEVKEFQSSDIWNMRDDVDDKGLDQYLPWFTFEVNVSEISIEDPGEQDTAYVGVSYSADDFEINGVLYNDTYQLYLFNSSAYYEDMGEALSYSEFMEKKGEIFEAHREWFTEIKPIADMNKDDEEYELYKDYNWSASGLSFVPQDANAFYLIKCKVTSSEDARNPIVGYMGIAASARVKPIPGEDTWLQDNMTSIILLSIAGAALVGIVLLWVIKPRNKGDIDVQFEAEKKSKGKKRK